MDERAPRDKKKVKFLWFVFWFMASGIGVGFIVNGICRWYVALPVRLW